MQDPRPSESDLDQALEQARKAWLDSMHEFVNEWQDTVDLPTYPLLSEQHLENCRVLPNRLVLLDKMPQRSIVAEVGVKKGAFSAQLLERCQPSRLHLIDRNLKKHKIKKKFETEISNGVVHLHQGDSTTVRLISGGRPATGCRKVG